MKSFKEKLQTLLENLQKARDEVDPVEGCKILAIEFGDDFPIPEESVTAQKRIRYACRPFFSVRCNECNF